MTGLEDQLRKDVAEAMREGDNSRRDVLRMMLAAIKQQQVDEQVELDDDGVLAVLMKQAKQRRESIADAQKAKRPDLATQEEAELSIIEEYLPQQLTENEIRSAAADIIAGVEASGMQDMGKVMGELMPRLQGQADGRLVSQIVRDLLQA
jgi:uncharacterized protein YqeY